MVIKLCFYAFMVFLAFFVIIIIWQMNAYKVSEPSYLTLKTEGPITIRQYPTITVAQVEMNGDRYYSINYGFKLLANYIFGENKEKLKIAMTAPVMQTQVMTVNTDSKNKKPEDNKWIIRFVMPANYDKTKLPEPNNLQVKLSTIAEKKYIVISFSGFNTETNLNSHLDELKNYINRHRLHTVGYPLYAFYNPPWILPFLRRNEIMLELDK